MSELYSYYYDPDRPGFLEFAEAVNKIAEQKIGMGILDLPDQDYSSFFADELSPEDAWEIIVENEGLEDF